MVYDGISPIRKKRKHLGENGRRRNPIIYGHTASRRNTIFLQTIMRRCWNLRIEDVRFLVVEQLNLAVLDGGILTMTIIPRGFAVCFAITAIVA